MSPRRSQPKSAKGWKRAVASVAGVLGAAAILGGCGSSNQPTLPKVDFAATHEGQGDDTFKLRVGQIKGKHVLRLVADMACDPSSPELVTFIIDHNAVEFGPTICNTPVIDTVDIPSTGAKIIDVEAVSTSSHLRWVFGAETSNR